MAAATLHAAFGIPAQLESIGAVAGLAAILGLAVLSVLYFAQARELKRLREWAGRAPERAAEVESRVADQAQRRVQAQPARPAAAQGQPARPGQPAQPKTAPATAAAAAAGAATAVPPGQTGQPGQPAAPANGETGTPAAPGTPAPKPATPGQPAPATGQPAAPGQPAEKPATPGEGDGAAQPPRTGQPAAPGTPRPAAAPTPAGQQTSVRPAGTAPRTAAGAGAAAGAARRPPQPLRATPKPSATAPARGRGAVAPPPAASSGGRSRRSIFLVVGAVALVLAGGVFAFTQLSGGDDPATEPPPNQIADAPAEDEGTDPSAGTTAPRGQTTVAVLNGTTIPGLARSVADRVVAGGYRIGAVTNAPDQQRAATQVAYQPGQERAARQVAQLVDVGADAVVPIDEVTSATAGDEAVVVVTVGADQSP